MQFKQLVILVAALLPFSGIAATPVPADAAVSEEDLIECTVGFSYKYCDRAVEIKEEAGEVTSADEVNEVVIARAIA